MSERTTWQEAEQRVWGEWAEMLNGGMPRRPDPSSGHDVVWRYVTKCERTMELMIYDLMVLAREVKGRQQPPEPTDDRTLRAWVLDEVFRVQGAELRGVGPFSRDRVAQVVEELRREGLVTIYEGRAWLTSKGLEAGRPRLQWAEFLPAPAPSEVVSEAAEPGATWWASEAEPHHVELHNEEDGLTYRLQRQEAEDLLRSLARLLGPERVAELLEDGA